MVSQKTAWLTLLLVLLLAAGLRLIYLNRYPPGFNYDEVSHAYNAWSLLRTGRDQWGTAFPFPNFRAYGDYPTVLNLYLTVPVLAWLGPTDFAARLPHAVAGILACAAAYALALAWSKNRLLALLVALLYAVSPWTFFPSRAVFQSNWTVLLLTLGLGLYFRRRFLLTCLVLVLSLFAYHNTRIFVPLIIPVLFWPLRRRTGIVAAGLVTGLLALVLLLLPQSRARSGWVGIVDAGAVARIEQWRNTTRLPAAVSRLVYNRPAYFLATTARNYLDYFSWPFLFLAGGTQYQYSLPGYGVLNPVLLPFFYLGLIWLLLKRRWLILFWLLLSPLPAAVTRDRFAVIRATAMIPAVILTVTYGIMAVAAHIRGWRRYVLWSLFIAGFCLSGYYRDYFTVYPVRYARDWQAGYRQAVDYIRQHQADYDRIVITKYYAEPHEYLLWYWPWPPEAFISDSRLVWDYHSDWYWVDRFAGFEFVNDWNMPEYTSGLNPETRTLIVSSPYTPTAGRQKAITLFSDGSPAFVFREL